MNLLNEQVMEIPDLPSVLNEASTGRRMSLREIWSQRGWPEPPEQHVLDMFAEEELDTQLSVYEVYPGSLLGDRGVPINKFVRKASKPPHREIVARYRQEPGPPIVLMGSRILDGHHRAMAAYLEKRLVEAVQADELPETFP